MTRNSMIQIVAGGLLVCALGTASAWAETSTATATVAATIAPRAEATLTRDDGSVIRYSAGQLVFDRVDDQDGQADGSAGFMYAPYRSETGKNWHVVNIVANGSSMTLSAAVTGTAGSTPLANILKTYCGGFYSSGNSTPISGTRSTGWETLNGFTRTLLNQPFTGTAPFNYQLNIAALGAGSYAGQVTFTLTSN